MPIRHALLENNRTCVSVGRCHAEADDADIPGRETACPRGAWAWHPADEATPTRTAKPDGVRGAQIWVKIGDPAPLDPSELTFLATDTRTPYVATFDGADANKVAHYMLRWENTRGETGPWSETASATIGA